MSHDIAFLHTAEVHVATFDALVDELGPTLRRRSGAATTADLRLTPVGRAASGARRRRPGRRGEL